MRIMRLMIGTAVMVAAGMTACNSELGVSDGPISCTIAAEVQGCGQACEDISDCASGLYCSTSGTCDADCVPGGNNCTGTDICSATGQCVPSGIEPPDAGDCPSIDVALDPVTPTIMLIVDRSGSMAWDFAGIRSDEPGFNPDEVRWEAVKTALTDETTGIVTTMESNIRFGISLFRKHPNSAVSCPDLVDDAPAFSNANDIRALLTANAPAGGTPTAQSIDAVVEFLNANPPPNNEPVVIVLATDGEPNLCSAGDPSEPETTEAAAVAAYAAGYQLYPLSVGNEIGEAHLQRMANAGQGLPLNGSGGDAPLHRATDPTGLANTFTEIITGARSCELNLDHELNLSEADTGTVILNGDTLTFGVGWNVVDSMTIALIGDACDTFKTSTNVTLSAEFPCGAVID